MEFLGFIFPFIHFNFTSSDFRRLQISAEKSNIRRFESSNSQVLPEFNLNGNLIFSNFSSFIDILILFYLFRPEGFVKINSDGTLSIASFLEMFKLSTGYKGIKSSETNLNTKNRFLNLFYLQKYLEQNELCMFKTN